MSKVKIMVLLMIQNQSNYNDNEALANHGNDTAKSSNDPNPGYV